MAKSLSYCARLGLLVGVMLCLWHSGNSAFAQVNANVEFSNISQQDPHPIIYTWNGKKEPGDPSHFNTFFYIGTVDPDARVPKNLRVERVAISLDEWEANYKWMVLKLKYYYQLNKNLPGTALAEMTGEAPIQTTTKPAAGQPGAAMPGGVPGMPGGMPGMPGAMGNEGGMNPGVVGQGGDVNAMGANPPLDANGQPMLNPDGTPMVNPDMMQGDMNNPNALAQDMTGGGNGMMTMATPANFDAQAAAEWTFFYDQLVLWQYYCARQILSMESELLEQGATSSTPTAGAPGVAVAAIGAGGRSGGRGARGGVAGAVNGMLNNGMIPGMAGQAGMMNGGQQAPGVTLMDLAAQIQPGEAGKQTIEAIKKQSQLSANGRSGSMGMMPRMQGMGMQGMGMQGMGMQGMQPGMPGGSLGQMSQQYTGTTADNMMMPGGGMNAMMPQVGGAMTGANGAGGAGLRETFNPAMDFMNPDRVNDYRQRYQDAADQREQELYKNFCQMITDIEQREDNQDNYEKWIANKRKELYNFADDWHRAEQGDVLTVNDTLFVVTKDPSEVLPLNAVGIPKAGRVTPADLINEDGLVKKPKVE